MKLGDTPLPFISRTRETASCQLPELPQAVITCRREFSFDAVFGGSGDVWWRNGETANS